MKNTVRITISTVTLIALVTAFFFISNNSKKERSLKTCEGLNVVFADDYRFINEKDIQHFLEKNYGPYIGARLDSLKLSEIEKIIDAQSAVLKSEAYTTDDGRLNIRLRQREPVVRFQKGSTGFYADGNGFIFPLHRNYTSRVPVIDGNIPIDCPEGYKGLPEKDSERVWLSGVLEMIRTMDKHKSWSQLMVQMNVDSDGDLIMIPFKGNERFIFGSPWDAEDKFKRIEKYYKYILPEKGEDYYRTVNVKFDKQIVCKK